MQEANPDRGTYAREIPLEMLGSVRELNRRFLDLCGAPPAVWRAPRPDTGSGGAVRVATLSAAQKDAIADCPFALFELHFHDGRRWQERLRTSRAWGVADAALDPRAVEFARLAVFFAWHAAFTAPLAAQLLLGMHADTAAALRDAPIDCLPSVAAAETGQLTARWNHRPPYWSALADAAVLPDRSELRRLQLHGLQLSAAARLF